MKKFVLPFFVFLSISFLANAQTDVNKMLKDINGKVDEIVIKSGGKDFTFSGDEAEKLFSAMKQDKKMKHFEFITKDGKHFYGDNLKKKIIIKELDADKDEKEITVIVGDDDEELSGDIHKIEKKVLVSEESGKKVVTVTTTEDGKENIEVLEGKAADEYLEKMKTEDHCKIKTENDGCCNKKHKKIIIEKEIK